MDFSVEFNASEKEKQVKSERNSCFFFIFLFFFIKREFTKNAFIGAHYRINRLY